MNTKTSFTIILIAAAALATAPVFARGGGGGNGRGAGGGAMWNNGGSIEAPAGFGAGNGRMLRDPAACDLSGPGQGTPLRDGSGKLEKNRGNPNSTGTPLRDGSGKATAPGKGPKDGTGNNANCPNLPPAG